MNKKLSILSLFLLIFITTNLHCLQKICIIIPAYNEEHRIQKMLDAYLTYFKKLQKKVQVTFIVSANNCSDQTVPICKKIQKNNHNLQILDFKPGGKGFALKQAYLYALQSSYDYIGFVDADLATLPEHFYDLIKQVDGYDGAIASRYKKGAHVWPKRSAFRVISGKAFNWVLKKQFDIPFDDTQCGAKIFSYKTIKLVAPQLQEVGWNCDLEILYLCQKEGKKIKEVPTTWRDQPGSHLELSTKLIKDFLTAPRRIKQNHNSRYCNKKIKKKRQKNKNKNLQCA